MRIEVNGVPLFFDVEGAKLAPDASLDEPKQAIELVRDFIGA